MNTLMALSESAQPQPDKPPTTVSSKLPKSGGGYLSIDFNTWKPKYVDEYTGEVLRDDLVQEAMIDELCYFNTHVWEAEAVDKMKQVSDHILVRSRWVMVN